MENTKIKIAVADDHEVFLDGLVALLQNEADFEVVAAASNGSDLCEKVRELQPDVAVVDLQMPGINGFEAIKQITQDTATRCLVLSSFATYNSMADALTAGATGYIIKNAEKGVIPHGVRTLASGEPFYCRETAAILFHTLSNRRLPRSGKNAPFSSKEIQVLFLIGQEKSNVEIGEEMFLSPRTIEGIRSEMMRKMKVRTATGMVVYALKNNLFSLEELNYGPG